PERSPARAAVAPSSVCVSGPPATSNSASASSTWPSRSTSSPPAPSSSAASTAAFRNSSRMNAPLTPAVRATSRSMSDTASRRLQEAGQAAHRLDRLDRRPGQDQDRPPRHAGGQVHGRQRLAGARLAVQQDAPLDVPAGRLEPLGVPAQADGVPLDPPEHHI